MSDQTLLDTARRLHVGDSNFEGWFAAYQMAHKGAKQIARDAYAAGMEDPLVASAADAGGLTGEQRDAVGQILCLVANDHLTCAEIRRTYAPAWDLAWSVVGPEYSNAHVRQTAITAPSPALPELIEQIAQQWDGCIYKGVGEDIDIGEAIRSAAAPDQARGEQKGGV